MAIFRSCPAFNASTAMEASALLLTRRKRTGPSKDGRTSFRRFDAGGMASDVTAVAVQGRASRGEDAPLSEVSVRGRRPATRILRPEAPFPEEDAASSATPLVGDSFLPSASTAGVFSSNLGRTSSRRRRRPAGTPGCPPVSP
uniref:Uncharacterized protein n=1 Tax=Triticum urartu TaxID=4572 RepID=A0A8R7R2N1_TRIUA